MTELHRLYNEHGQSPWLDNLTRSYIRDGTLAGFVDASLIASDNSILDAYWYLVIDDVRPYVDHLIGPETVNTLPENTIAAFEDNGVLARSIDGDVDDAAAVLEMLAMVGVDMEDVGLTLEDQGVTSLHQSFAHLLDTLTTKAHQRSDS